MDAHRLGFFLSVQLLSVLLDGSFSLSFVVNAHSSTKAAIKNPILKGKFKCDEFAKIKITSITVNHSKALRLSLLFALFF
jgi:hypothetical protein